MTLEDYNNDDEETIKMPDLKQTNCIYLEDCSRAYHHKGCYENDYESCSIYKFRTIIEAE